MSNQISNVGTGQQPSMIGGDKLSEFTKGLGLNEKSNETIKEIVSLLGGRNVSVNANERTTNGETGKPSGATGAPALDNPADIKQVEANLEKLLSYLQMDNEERQAEMAKDRIDIQKDTLETERKGRSEKIDKSLKEMEKAAKSRLANKIFGWLMTAIAVVAAIVACVATVGFATGPVIAAGIAVTCQILNETGVMDKIVEKLAKALEDAGMSKEASQILAQVLITVAILAASISTGFLGGGGGSILNAFKHGAETMDRIRAAVAITASVIGVSAMITSGVATYQNYSAGLENAEVKDTEKIITALKQRLDECEEELQQILEQLQNAVAQVADLLTSATDTSKAIAQNLGAMA